MVSWSGFSTDGATTVFANGISIATATPTGGGGSYTYTFKGGGTFTYQVCLANTQSCSNAVTVTF